MIDFVLNQTVIVWFIVIKLVLSSAQNFYNGLTYNGTIKSEGPSFITAGLIQMSFVIAAFVL